MKEIYVSIGTPGHDAGICEAISAVLPHSRFSI